MHHRTPARILRIGIVTVAVGVVLLLTDSVVVPNVPVFQEPAGQALLGVIGLLSSAIQFAAIPLGCAFIGAGLVMGYIRALHLSRDEA